MGNKTRVLHIFGKRPTGGVETFLMNMHRNVDSSKVQFDYLINTSLPDGDFDQKVKALGGNVYVLPELKYSNTFKYLIELYRFFKENQYYKIIHVHSGNIAIFNFLIAIRFGIKYRIVHSHSTKYSDKTINSLRNFFLQLPVKVLANIYFACSLDAATFLFGRRSVRNNKVHIIKNAIDARKFQYDKNIREEVRRRIGIEDKVVIGHVGAFQYVKNHDYIIDVFVEVYKMNSQSILLLVGIGELEKRIKEKVKRLNLERAVMFMGVRDDVNELMQAFDVFILPSKFEGLPFVGLEAQAAGLPCVFSNTVSEEVEITDLVVFKSINTSPKEWANQVLLESSRKKRLETLNSIQIAGYDILDSAEKLQKFYLDLK